MDIRYGFAIMSEVKSGLGKGVEHPRQEICVVLKFGNYSFINTFTLVKFLLSWVAFTEVSVGVYTCKMFT